MKRIITLALILLCGSVCQSAQIGTNSKRVNVIGEVKSGFSQSLMQPTLSKFGPKGQICAGVNIHFVTGHEKDLDLIAAAGFKFIRMDFGWQGTERVKGIFNWKSFDELTANLEKRGLGAIYIFDYSNSLYEESNKAYLITYSEDTAVKTNLVHILHQADFMASKIETQI